MGRTVHFFDFGIQNTELSVSVQPTLERSTWMRQGTVSRLAETSDGTLQPFARFQSAGTTSSSLDGSVGTVVPSRSIIRAAPEWVVMQIRQVLRSGFQSLSTIQTFEPRRVAARATGKLSSRNISPVFLQHCSVESNIPALGPPLGSGG